MSRIGTVRELNGNYAIISTSRRGICEGCSDKSSCSFDNALGKSVPEVIMAVNPVQAKPGDQVEFDLTGHTELKTSLIVWIVPLIGLILGAAAGSYFHGLFGLTVDSGTLIGLGLGLLAGFSLVVVYERFIVVKESTLPVLLKIMPNQSCNEIH
jgi:sigma-E factor negative regulatory protein RseC